MNEKQESGSHVVLETDEEGRKNLIASFLQDLLQK
jgi:hypothetical protein